VIDSRSAGDETDKQTLIKIFNKISTKYERIPSGVQQKKDELKEVTSHGLRRINTLIEEKLGAELFLQEKVVRISH